MDFATRLLWKYSSRANFHNLFVAIWEVGMSKNVSVTPGIRCKAGASWIYQSSKVESNQSDFHLQWYSANLHFFYLLLLSLLVIHNMPALKKKNSHNHKSINRHNTVCIKSRRSVTFNQESQFISKLFSTLHLPRCFVALHCQPRKQLWFDQRQRWICVSWPGIIRAPCVQNELASAAKQKGGWVVISGESILQDRKVADICKDSQLFVLIFYGPAHLFPLCDFEVRPCGIVFTALLTFKADLHTRKTSKYQRGR